MENDIVNKVKYKIWCAEQNAKIAARKSFQWVKDNKETLTVVIPMAIGFIGGVDKLARRVDLKRDLKKEQELKDLRVYNRSTGDYLTLRRKMTAKEQVMYEARKKNGESTASILYDMGLLK